MQTGFKILNLMDSRWKLHARFTWLLVDRNEDVETVELSEHTVNPGEPKTGPQDFELLKLLGKGGYGKV